MKRETISIIGCIGCTFCSLESCGDYPDSYFCNHPEGPILFDVKQYAKIKDWFLIHDECPFLKANYLYELHDNFILRYEKSLKDKREYEEKLQTEIKAKDELESNRKIASEITTLKNLAAKYPDLIKNL